MIVVLRKEFFKVLKRFGWISEERWNDVNALLNSVRKKSLISKRNTVRGMCGYVNHILSKAKRTGKEECFVPFSQDIFFREQGDLLILAYYLTQFYETEINNQNFGKGFTEWTNTTKAVPQFCGHYQPHIPIDVGFYDLSNPKVMYRQVELAKKYGIGGFCFYYYWFSGKRVLEKPLFNWLENKDLDFPFCLFWANESWVSRWFGGDKKTILDFKFDASMVEHFFNDTLAFFEDERYIKIDGKPFFIIYHPDMFTPEEMKEIISRFNALAIKHGFPGIYFCGQGYGLQKSDVKKYGLDAVCEFSPCGMKVSHTQIQEWTNPDFAGTFYDIRKFIETKKYEYNADYPLYKGVFTAWDNTPRNSSEAKIFYGMTPVLYKRWLKSIISWSKTYHPADRRIIFVNAWNEWGEGAHLEPDLKFGYAYLQATKEAIEETRRRDNDKL